MRRSSLSLTGGGGGGSADYTLYTSGDVGQEERSFLKKAGIQQELGRTSLKLFRNEIRNDCRLEMHFYDIVYQHEDSA